VADLISDRVLDRALPVAAERAGAPGELRFTERQLYYQVCRVLLPAHRLPRRLSFTLPAPVRYSAFQAALRRHGPVPGLLTLVPARPASAGRHTPEPDLFDYGLPRLLVCESDAIAQMLRANGIPMESACPVLSAAELPLDPRVAGMLTKVDRAAVYLLHDASARGLTFRTRVTELTDIPDGVRVVSLGLRPDQAAALHLFRRRDRRARRDRCVEIEAVRPASLLRTVHRLVREVCPPRTRLDELRGLRTAGFLTWPAT
jgi:hypothetical protein